MLRRKDVQYALIFLALYVVWLIWPVYGIMPFFAFAALIVSKYLKTRRALRQLTRKAKDQFPNKLPKKNGTCCSITDFPFMLRRMPMRSDRSSEWSNWEAMPVW